MRRSTSRARQCRASRRSTRNQMYGTDATLAFFTNLSINSYWTRTATTGLPNDDTSYRGQLDYAADRYGVQVEHLKIGANFDPEVGFLRRSNIRKDYAGTVQSPAETEHGRAQVHLPGHRQLHREWRR